MSFAIFFLLLKSTCVNLLANPMWFPEMNILNYTHISNLSQRVYEFKDAYIMHKGNYGLNNLLFSYR